MPVEPAPAPEDETLTGAAARGRAPHPHRDPTSVLGQLAQRREEIRAEQVLTKSVPRWRDPRIEIDYQPVEHEVVSRAQRFVTQAGQAPTNRAQRRAKGGDRVATAELDANADILIAGCIGVWAVIDGERYSLDPEDRHGAPTTFDPVLAEVLGLEDDEQDARTVVKKLFIAEGDVISQAREVAEWSGYRIAQADEDLEGE